MGQIRFDLLPDQKTVIQPRQTIREAARPSHVAHIRQPLERFFRGSPTGTALAGTATDIATVGLEPFSREALDIAGETGKRFLRGEEEVTERITRPLTRIEETGTRTLPVFLAKEAKDIAQFLRPSRFLPTVGGFRAAGAAAGQAARVPAIQRFVRRQVPTLGKRLIRPLPREGVAPGRELAVREPLKRFAPPEPVPPGAVPSKPLGKKPLREGVFPEKTQKAIRKLAEKEPSVLEKTRVSTEVRRKLVGREAAGLGEAIIRGEEGGLAAAGDIEAARLIKVINQNPEIQGDISKILNAFQRTKKFGAEAARALQARKEIGKNLNDSILKNLKKAITRTTDVAQKEELQGLLTDLTKAKSLNPRALDYVLEVWISGLLSAPQTIERNILGNIQSFTINPVVKFTQGLISKIPGTKNKSVLGESVLEVAGTIRSLPKTAQTALANIVAERPEMLVESIQRMIDSPHTPFAAKAALKKILPLAARITKGVVSRTNRIVQAMGKQAGVIKGPIGQVIRAPFRLLRAGDEGGFVPAFESTRRAMVFRELRKKGVGLGQAFITSLKRGGIKEAEKQLSKQVLTNIENEATKEAFEVLFLRELGAGGKAVTNLTTQIKGLKFVIPFFKTLLNISKRLVDHSPIGFLTSVLPASLKAGGLEARATSKAITGTVGATALFYWLKRKGIELIPAAKNRQERASLERRGLQESSIVLKDGTNIQFKNVEPATQLLEAIAVIQDTQRRQAEGQPTGLAVGEGIERFVKSFANENFLRGVKQILDQAFEPNERGFANFINRFVASFIPNIFQQVQKSQDPFVREGERDIGGGTVEAIQRRLPGVAKELPIARTVFGEPRIRPREVGPFKVRKKIEDPVEDELARLKIFPDLPKRRQKGVQITEAERREIVKRVGPAKKNLLRRVVTNPRYQAASDEAKKAVIRSITSTIGIVQSAFVEQLLTDKFLKASPEERERIIFEFKNR